MIIFDFFLRTISNLTKRCILPLNIQRASKEYKPFQIQTVHQKQELKEKNWGNAIQELQPQAKNTAANILVTV